jgi:hypothetical protein
MDYLGIYDAIKKDFGDLFSFKRHDEDLFEINTPLSTLTDKFVSVFIIKRGAEFIVTDCGWLLQSQYEIKNPILPENCAALMSYYGVKQNESQFFYKKTDDISLLSSIIFDIAHFILNMVNLHSLVAVRVFSVTPPASSVIQLIQIPFRTKIGYGVPIVFPILGSISCSSTRINEYILSTDLSIEVALEVFFKYRFEVFIVGQDDYQDTEASKAFLEKYEDDVNKHDIAKEIYHIYNSKT